MVSAPALCSKTARLVYFGIADRDVGLNLARAICFQCGQEISFFIEIEIPEDVLEDDAGSPPGGR